MQATYVSLCVDMCHYMCFVSAIWTFCHYTCIWSFIHVWVVTALLLMHCFALCVLCDLYYFVYLYVYIHHYIDQFGAH